MRLLIAVLVLLLVACWARPAPVPVATRGEVTVARDARDHRIRPGDVLEILVWKNDQLTRTVTVLPDGSIFVPLLNEVHAVGLTPRELTDLLVRRYEEYVPSPLVSVLVSEVKGFSVSVMGEVKNPGRYEITASGTVLDALALAGGFTDFASISGIGILRKDGEVVRRIDFEYKKAIRGDPEKNFSVQPGDIIVVP
jgi:polysaccharide biosynthesis/export protein